MDFLGNAAWAMCPPARAVVARAENGVATVSPPILQKLTPQLRYRGLSHAILSRHVARAFAYRVIALDPPISLRSRMKPSGEIDPEACLFVHRRHGVVHQGLVERIGGQFAEILQSFNNEPMPCLGQPTHCVFAMFLPAHPAAAIHRMSGESDKGAANPLTSAVTTCCGPGPTEYEPDSARPGRQRSSSAWS
jgi:hypothetical protein